MEQSSTNRRPLIIAVTIAIIALLWYIASGRSSFDLGTRELTHSPGVDQVDASSSERITITCANGEAYQILFTEGQSDYNELIFNACGPQGVRE